MIEDKDKVTKEQVAITATQVIHEYKKSKDFKNDVTVARVDYVFSFTNYRDMVAQAYPKLDLSHILMPGEEGRQEEVVILNFC